ncbi:MAG: hypothetical protein WCV90_08630 [Candidatus Woesearchaeota archaeon]|jgi:hypothetical protein
MNLNQTLFVVSKSRYDLLLERTGSIGAAKDKVGSSEIWGSIEQGHLNQKENLRRITTRFGLERVIDRSQLTLENIISNGCFVFLGGDDHFTYCSQMILDYQRDNSNDQKQVMGVSLDPLNSFGHNLYFDANSLLESIPRLEQGDYLLEAWTTLEASVYHGSEVNRPYLAIGDYFVGETNRLLMSRNKVFINEKEVMNEKSSGLLVACGAGSVYGTWYGHAYKLAFGGMDTFPKESEVARVILTEQEKDNKLTLEKGQTLVVHSYNDGEGIVSPDSHLDHSVNFDLGCVAEISISDQKLHVIKSRESYDG